MALSNSSLKTHSSSAGAARLNSALTECASSTSTAATRCLKFSNLKVLAPPERFKPFEYGADMSQNRRNRCHVQVAHGASVCAVKQCKGGFFLTKQTEDLAGQKYRVCLTCLSPRVSGECGMRAERALWGPLRRLCAGGVLCSDSGRAAGRRPSTGSRTPRQCAPSPSHIPPWPSAAPLFCAVWWCFCGVAAAVFREQTAEVSEKRAAPGGGVDGPSTAAQPPLHTSCPLSGVSPPPWHACLLAGVCVCVCVFGALSLRQQ